MGFERFASEAGGLARSLDFGPLDLNPPLFSLGEAGEPVPLPERMPNQVAQPLSLITIADAQIAVSPETRRAYLLDRDGKPVAEAIDDSPNVRRRAERDLRAFAASGVEPQPQASPVALVSGQRGGYWHWWVDVISRVWLLEEYGRELASLPLAFAPRRRGYQADSVERLELGERCHDLRPGISRFPAVTFASGVAPAASRFPSSRLAEYARWLQVRIAGDEKRSMTGSGRRLFVSRGDVSSRRLANEEELQAVLEQHGFERVECARLPLASQITIFAEASLVIGPHGGGLTNLLFSPEGTGVLELFAAPAGQPVSNYRALSSHLGQPYARLLAAPIEVAGRSPHDLDMRIDPHLLGRALEALGA
ncbi:MAG TPA: glycosyltransferase family 61 protein [Solirubrobacterales bacterium]|nr:glycosyltransferase family 61 protein [Solirubrobacterales bacterium]